MGSVDATQMRKGGRQGAYARKATLDGGRLWVGYGTRTKDEVDLAKVREKEPEKRRKKLSKDEPQSSRPEKTNTPDGYCKIAKCSPIKPMKKDHTTREKKCAQPGGGTGGGKKDLKVKKPLPPPNALSTRPPRNDKIRAGDACRAGKDCWQKEKNI